MPESDEIAQSLIAKHGSPTAKTWDEMAAWLVTVWPDWREWIGHQQRDNIVDALMRLGPS